MQGASPARASTIDNRHVPQGGEAPGYIPLSDAAHLAKLDLSAYTYHHLGVKIAKLQHPVLGALRDLRTSEFLLFRKAVGGRAKPPPPCTEDETIYTS